MDEERDGAELKTMAWGAAPLVGTACAPLAAPRFPMSAAFHAHPWTAPNAATLWPERNAAMRIAIASGKGGTGKTTVATNLAVAAARCGQSVHLMDCDVEEPNCHLYVHPVISSSDNVCIPVPKIDTSRCTGCGACVDACQFNALACPCGTVLTFPELCHGCGVCRLVCPAGAITDAVRPIGVIEGGTTRYAEFTQGRLRVGEPMARPLIRRMKSYIKDADLTVIDCPPGTSCSAIEAVRDADHIVVVAEPTPFGLSDFRLIVEMLRIVGLAFSAIVNRSDIGDGRVQEFCKQEGISVLLEITEDRSIPIIASCGGLAVEAIPTLEASFGGLLRKLEREALERVA